MLSTRLPSLDCLAGSTRCLGLVCSTTSARFSSLDYSLLLALVGLGCSATRWLAEVAWVSDLVGPLFDIGVLIIADAQRHAGLLETVGTLSGVGLLLTRGFAPSPWVALKDWRALNQYGLLIDTGALAPFGLLVDTGARFLHLGCSTTLTRC